MMIGVSGYARAGKDTVGAYLRDNHGFTRLAFADTLKRFALAINPIVDATLHDGEVQLCRLYDELSAGQFDWEAAKENPEVRALLQRIGTEGGRNVLGENVWVDATLSGVDPHADSWVITDVRFPNEAAAIKGRGGLVWRVERVGTEPVNAHPSETALDDYPFDALIENNGTLEDLHSRVDEFLNRS